MADVGSVAGIIAASATVITAIGGVIVSLRVLVPIKNQGEATSKIVNGQRTDAAAYAQQLRRALADAGIRIPDDASLPAAPPPDDGPTSSAVS
jgi:hypothetical protein